MGESQSRYSIVERLTQSKLDLLTSKSELDGEVKVAEQRVAELKKKLEDWNTDIYTEVDRNKRVKERDIEQAERDATNLKDRLGTQKANYDEKLLAIELALHSIEEISKSAASQES